MLPVLLITFIVVIVIVSFRKSPRYTSVWDDLQDDLLRIRRHYADELQKSQWEYEDNLKRLHADWKAQTEQELKGE